MEKQIAFITIALLLLTVSCMSEEDAPYVPFPDAPYDIKMSETISIDYRNNIGCDVFAKLLESKPGQNVLISPQGLGIELSMLANGGEAFESVFRNINGGLDAVESNALSSKLLSNLPLLSDAVGLDIATSMWVDGSVSQAFEGLMKEIYLSDVEDNRISNDNLTNWLGLNTSQSYNMPDAPFDGELAAALMLNFKGSWTNAFDVTKTKDGKFFNSDGTVSTVKFMNGSESGIEWLNSEEMNAFKREFGVKRGFRVFNYTVTFLIPKDGYSVEECLGRLVKERCNMGFFENLASNAVGNLSMPKFSLDCVTDVASLCDIPDGERKYVLSELPLEGVSRDKVLNVNNLIQCVSITFDENGADGEEAYDEDTKPDGRPFNEHVDVVIDRPFLFFVTESYSNAMLLFGVINKL